MANKTKLVRMVRCQKKRVFDSTRNQSAQWFPASNRSFFAFESNFCVSRFGTIGSSPTFRFPHSFHGVENSVKDQGDVAASNEGVVKKVHNFFVLPCHQKGGLTLTDLKAEIAKILGSYDLADKFLYYSFDNEFNSITATLTEDQVESIKKSLKVISVMDDDCLELHRM